MALAAKTAERYVAAMNAGDLDAMMSLFAPDAVMRHPTGVYTGSESIRDFFLEIAFGNAARLERVALLAEGDMAWLEVEATSKVTPGRQRVVDVFRLDAQGRILDLGIYSGNTVPGSNP